ncbi:MAG: thiamine biosynthesis protein ThiS [Candidatus Omnitrophica bacterium CG1_02_49_10]|nr:MAG: thiamine biosynthesis protein ThiS [Candidatus Omnitrophica bacterium CG1_02_49_10]
MKIEINGKGIEAEDSSTVSDILKVRNIREEVVTVELNGGIVERAGYPESRLKDGDKLELVYYMGGGLI